MAEIVLVHGAFHGGWCWRAVADRLSADGHRVFQPTLTGLGERAHLASASIDLDTHIQDVVNVIECEELDRVVLVAHSYGGMPATGAADALAGRLAALVYLDAYTPADGDSAIAVRTAVPGFLALDEPEDGFRVPPPPAGAFGLDGALGAWAERRMTAQPLATMTQPIRLTGAWRAVGAKLYLRLAQFAAPYFDAYFEAAHADPAWHALRADKPHNVMMTDPAWLTDLLAERVL